MKWFNQGNKHFQEAQYDQAIECWQKALKIGRHEKNDQVVSKSLMNIGTALGAQGEWDKAIQFYHQSLEIEKRGGNSPNIAECLMNIGDAFFALEKVENARDYYLQSLELYGEYDRNRARMLLHIGLALFTEGNWKKAIQYYKQSLELFKEMDDLDGISKCFANLGIAFRNVGKWEEAIQYYKQSLEIDQKLSDQLGSATCLMNIGIALEALGKVKEAIEHYQRSLASFKSIGNDKGIATCLLNLGNAFEILEKWENAVEFYEKSIELFENLGDKSSVSKSLTNIGIALRNLGRWDEAIKKYHESMSWFESLNDQAAISKCLLDLGVAYHSVGKWDEALKYYQKSRKLFQILGDEPGEALACQNLGWGYQEHNEKKLALQSFIEAFGIYTNLLTRISTDEYRESYAKEFKNLPRIIDSLSVVLEEQPMEIKELIPPQEMEESPNLMNELLSQLRTNITELNTAVKAKTAPSDISNNLTVLKELVDRTLLTFSVTEKLMSEKVGKNILYSIDTCNYFFNLYESCNENATAGNIHLILEEVLSSLKTSFPELDLIPAIQDRGKQLNTEFQKNQTLTESFALELRFVILAWIKRLYSIAISNKKLYLETIGKLDEPISQKLESELDAISQHLIKEEINYSTHILNYLIIIKKVSGIPIYNMNFIESPFDSDLVGGFLSAIQSFGAEIAKERTSMEKLAYKNFKINFQDGNFVRCALILKGEITELLSKKLKDFVVDFELEYQENLMRHDGNVTAFAGATSLVKKHFDLNK